MIKDIIVLTSGLTDIEIELIYDKLSFSYKLAYLYELDLIGLDDIAMFLEKENTDVTEECRFLKNIKAVDDEILSLADVIVCGIINNSSKIDPDYSTIDYPNIVKYESDPKNIMYLLNLITSMLRYFRCDGKSAISKINIRLNI